MIKYKTNCLFMFRRVWNVQNMWFDEVGNLIVAGQRKTVVIPAGSVIIAKGKAEEMLQTLYLGEVK